MQTLDVIRVFLEPLERNGYPYMITGSVATILYGAPRVTYDVDLVLDIPAQKAEEFAALFPISEFYCPPLEVLVAELNRAVRPHFNLIHHKSGFKADIYPCRDWLQRWGMGKRERIDWDGISVSVAPPEYVIVMKLEYYSEGGSEKHLTDIQRMVALVGDKLDYPWIESRVGERDLDAAWRRIKPANP